MRIGHEVAQARGEEARRLAHADAAPGQHARQHVGKAVRLRDRGPRSRRAGVAAVDPGAAEDGLVDAEKRARR